MAISDAVQTLTAAFSFGILFQGAFGVLLVYLKGHGATLSQDGRRLVLVLFLFFAAMWAQINFLSLLIPTKSSTACQTTLVFSSASDQLARVGIEQFLLWSVRNGSKVTREQLIMQSALGIRVIAGGLLVGFTRSEFAPTCVARTSLLPISIVVLALDFIIIGVLTVRAFSFGIFGALRGGRSNTHGEQSRALILSLFGYFVWTGMSVAMLLGIPRTLLIFRTTLPSIGLFILIAIISLLPNALLLPAEEQSTTPEATSPFVAPTPPSRDIFRSGAGNGSPVSGHAYTKSGSLFVVNPSATPRESPTALFQNDMVDNKGFTKLRGEVIVSGTGPIEQDQVSKNGPGYRGSSGIFPSIIRVTSLNPGSYAPHIRPASEITRDLPAISSSQQKRSLFSWSKPVPQPNVRRLGISRPLMTASQDSPSNPFARMQTIDLATAAANERERREGAAARSRHLADQPAPHSHITPQEALRRSVIVKRKGMPSQPQPHGPLPTIPSSGSSGLSVNAINGNTTSASLSPGREDIRRRSPRNGNNFDELFLEKTPTKPSLQQKQAIGLPSNPRSQRITMAREISRGAEQTVMFMKDIVYNDPGMVNTIINGAPETYESSKRTKGSEKSPVVSEGTTLRPSNSIIHRPRPYRRDSEKDRAFFLSEASPRHRRSKSGSSLLIRKSILRSHPGSPTQLPPLPAPPTSAAKLKRLLPNDTKSMTFDEKIQLLFPAPPGAAYIQHRRSSVPSLPRVPSVFISDTPPAQSPTEEEQQSRRASKRTTIATFGFQDFQIPEEPSKNIQNLNLTRQTYRFSANTYRTLADEVGETWIPGISATEANMPNPVLQERSPHAIESYDTRKSAFTTSTSSNESSIDGSVTDWGSIHSKVPAVDLSKAMRNARSTFIQPIANLRSHSPVSSVPQIEYNDQEENQTVILDPEDDLCLDSATNRKSFFLDANESLPGYATPKFRNKTAWHRRIGDELPTFSERKITTRARKMPPPTPLLLNSRSRNATIVVHAPEPSPADSPERAIKEIQAQLKRFEEPNSGSVGVIMGHLPNVGTLTNDQELDGDRFKLLDNLEKEMGEQQTQWQQMQSNLDRDSMSGTMSPPALDTSSSRASSRSSFQIPPQISSRRARVRSSMTVRSKGQDSTSTTSTQSSDNSRASVWQRRLAEAQMEYLENAPALLRKRSVNYLSLSKTHIGSPTPPESVESGDSETGSDLESESDTQYAPTFHANPPRSLWQPPLISPKAAIGRMWNPPYEVTVSAISSEPPAKYIRSSHRPILPALPIMSNALWKNPVLPTRNRPLIGLWGSKLARPRSIVTRRVTQRPQRKSRRVTFLPDIVESPQPIPNKRDTLGIFQFPWGETSDSAVYQPHFHPTPLARPILNPNLDARSRELEPESTEYSSSFFDDYDDEEQDDDSDDDFDENTLWEIASLLKSNNIPSKNSLLPPAREIIEDYDDDTDFESESEDQSPTNMKIINPKLPIQPLATFPKIESKLWVSSLDSAPTAPTGLPQPDAHIWQAYAPKQVDALRSKSRIPAALSTLSTSDLWVSPTSQPTCKATNVLWNFSLASGEESVSSLPVTKSSVGLWTQIPPRVESNSPGLFAVDATRPFIRGTAAIPAAENIVKISRSPPAGSLTLSSQKMWTFKKEAKSVTAWLSKPIASPTAALLWAPQKTIQSDAVVGLFTVSEQRSNYRTCDSLPAAINTVRKHRDNRAPLKRLASSELWNERETMQSDHHWISESSVRPETPSYSESSSGRSSPASDTSSVKSNSTKASSFWGSAGSIPACWDSKFAKKSSPHSSDGEIKVASKLPVVSLRPVRESRVLTSQDLWEKIAPNSKENPTIKLQKHDSSESTTPASNQPSHSQNRPIIGYRGDWDQAVAPAIEAGRPKLTRPAADKADWESALSAATSQGRARFQRPKCTLEDWEAALNEALPKILVSGIYDAAVKHPAFFTKALASVTDDVHAAFGYHVHLSAQSKRACQGGLWNKSIVEPSRNISISLWSKSLVCKRQEDTSELPKESTRKRLSPRSDDLPAFQSTALWRKSRPIPENRNWLLASQPAPVRVWVHVPRTISSLGSSAGMWEASRATSVCSPDLFTVIGGDRIRQPGPSRPAILPRLSSNEMFKPTTLHNQEIHWIEKTCFGGIPRPTTWQASAKSIEGEASAMLWTATKKTLSSPDMFSQVQSGCTRNHSSKAPADPLLLSSNKLFQLVSKPKVETHWLHSSLSRL